MASEEAPERQRQIEECIAAAQQLTLSGWVSRTWLVNQKATYVDAVSGRAIRAGRCERWGAAVSVRDQVGHYGEAWTERVSRDGLQDALEQAEAIASVSSPATADVRNDPGSSASPGTVVCDRTLSAASFEQKVALVNGVGRPSSTVDAEATSVWYEDGVTSEWFVEGVATVLSQTRSDVHLTVLVHDRVGGASAFGLSRSPCLVDIDPIAAFAEGLSDAERLRDRRAASPRRCPVFMQASAMAYVLSRYGELVAIGDQAQRRCGEGVAGAAVTIIDDPTLPSAPNSRLFDAMGQRTGRQVVIEAGKLNHVFEDEAGCVAGHAWRESYDEEPHAAASNLYMMPTVESRSELLKLAPNAIWIQAAHGFAPLGAPADDRLVLVFEGWKIVDAQPAEAIHGTFAISYWELFRRIVAVGPNPRFFPSAGPGAGSDVLLGWLDIGSA